MNRRRNINNAATERASITSVNIASTSSAYDGL
jgi:hypothetical protein